MIVMEYLSAEGYSLLNTADDTSVWTMSDMKVGSRSCIGYSAAVAKALRSMKICQCTQ